MSLSEHDVVAQVGRISVRRLRLWVRRGWVAPSMGSEGPIFDTLDVARVTLLCQLKDDCGLSDDALPLVLSLMDQLEPLMRRVEDARAKRLALTAARKSHDLHRFAAVDQHLVEEGRPACAGNCPYQHKTPSGEYPDGDFESNRGCDYLRYADRKPSTIDRVMDFVSMGASMAGILIKENASNTIPWSAAYMKYVQVTPSREIPSPAIMGRTRSMLRLTAEVRATALMSSPRGTRVGINA